MTTTFTDAIGRIVATVHGGTEGSDAMTMVFTDGSQLKLWHSQDCCESVRIIDVVGDWDDFIGQELLIAEERVDPPEAPPSTGASYESGTWTFYTFRCIKGSMDLRWLGSSNGYYSEKVTTEFVEPQSFSEMAEHVARGIIESRMRAQEVKPGVTRKPRRD